MLTAASKEPLPVFLQTFDDHSRLSLRVNSGIDHQWKDLPGGFEITFKGISLSDLGAPFGLESQWVEKFRDLSDSRLSLLRFYDSDEGLRVVGRWKYPKGNNAPAVPQMEFFSYRVAETSQFVLDFWLKKGPTVAEVHQKQLADKRKRAYEEMERRLKSRIQRRTASLQENTALADASQFCKRPLSPEYDVFLPFRPAHATVDFSKIYPLTHPDSDYPYWQPTGPDKESQYLRLALELYERGQQGLAIRTIEFFAKDFPKSSHRGQMKFLHANALVKLGYFDKAKALFRELMVEAFGSPVALHSAIYLAGQSMVQKNPLEAMEHFLWLVKNYPEHRLVWSFHMGVAESAYELKQTERAMEAYQWVAEKGPNSRIKGEAALKMGDLFLDRYQYAQALAQYYKAVQAFPTEAKKYAEVGVNRGEALYWLGEWDRSDKEFKDYLSRHRSHPTSWRASYRLGEIEGRKNGVTPDFQKWLYQAINDNPLSSGATLARLRLAPCGDHGGFNLDSARKFFNDEAANLKASSEIDMRDYQDMKGMSEFRTFVTLGEDAEAISVGARLIGGQLGQNNREIVTAAFNLVFRRYIMALLDHEKDFEAVSFYKKYEWAFSDKSPAILYDFLLRLSQAASKLSLGEFAQNLSEKYEKLTADWRKRELASSQPGDADVRARQSEEHFTKAISLWMGTGEKEEKAIVEHLEKVDAESPHSYEKELLLGVLAEETGVISSAIQHGTKAELLGKPSVADANKLKFWLARLYRKQKDFETATKLLQDLLLKIKKEDPKPADSISSTLLPVLTGKSDVYALLIEMAEANAKWGEVASYYSEILKEGTKDNRTLFSYARALEKTGKSEKQSEIISTLKEILKSPEDDFWKKLAQEALETKEGKS